MEASNARAVLLFAHGARDPAWAAPFLRVRDLLRAARPGVRVELAYLELMSPGFEEAVTGLYAEGVRVVEVAPLFMAPGTHLRRDLPRLAAACRTRHAGLEVCLHPSLGEADEIQAAIARWLVARLEL